MHTILVVDDDEYYRKMVARWLSKKEYRVVEAANGDQALALARRSPPAMVLCDILMPVMDGFALCGKWHQDDRLRSIPFILCSATYTDHKDEALGLNLGAKRFVNKSTDIRTMIKIVEDVLRTNPNEERNVD